MNILKKWTAAALLVALCLTLLTACSPNNDSVGGDAVTLTVWGAQEDQQLLRTMCEAFAKENPQTDYTFHYGVLGEGNAAEKILSDPTAGPDVYSFAGDQLSRLAGGGALARVGGDIEKTVRTANTEASVKAATLTIGGEDQLLAYPATGDNCYVLFYDKRVYTDESALSSLDSLLATAAAAGKKVHFKLNDDGWYLSSFFFSDPDLKYEVTYNDKMVEQAVDINYDSEGGLAVMKALRTYLGMEALVAQTDDSKIIAAFTPNAAGKTEAAAAVTGTWNAAAIRELLGDNMGVCKLPTATIGGQERQLSGYMGYKMIGVNGFSKNKGEAHKLAAYLTNEQNQRLRYETRGFAPTNKTVAAEENIQNDPVMKAVFDQSAYNRAQVGVPTTYWTPMAALITPIINAKAEGKTVTDAQLQEYLDALCRQIRLQK